MATVKFLIQSEKTPANIYLRLSISKEKLFKRKTGYVINPKNWSTTTNLPKQGDDENKQLKIDLDKLSTEIEKRLNVATSAKEEITGDWLQNQIDSISGKQKKTDEDRLTNYIQCYIDKLPNKSYTGGKTGVVKNTIQQYTTVKNKIVEYEKYCRKSFYVKNVGLNFIEDLKRYFTEIDKLNRNTAGKYIRCLKTICTDAGKNGIETNKQIADIKGMTEKTLKVYLTFDELERIEETPFLKQSLENARDWIIIGCYIGQRVSDLLKLTEKNIFNRSGLELIELTQKKTGKKIAIPLHPKVKEILTRNNGKFPYKIPDQVFNRHIKTICRLAEINEPIQGTLLIDLDEDNENIPQNEHRWRKESREFPKYRFTSSHALRRSFASNFYGEIPTPLLISITGHSTESQFLQYIGKTTNDYAVQVAEYWSNSSRKQAQMNKKEPQMTVLAKAQ